MIDRILNQATGARAVVALATLGIGGSLLFRMSPYAAVKSLLGGANLPEETITSPDRLAEILEVLGPAGRASYLEFQIWDLLNPILIGVAGAMLLGWLLKRTQRADSPWRFVIWLPVAVLAADLLENLVISIAVGTFPANGAIGFALPLVTATKFGAAMAMVASVVLLALVWIRDRLPGGQRPAT